MLPYLLLLSYIRLHQKYFHFFTEYYSKVYFTFAFKDYDSNIISLIESFRFYTCFNRWTFSGV